MLGIKKRDTKQVFKAIAHQQGVSVSEVKERIQSTIDEIYYSDDPDVQAEFSSYFGKKRPTPEEYVYTIATKIKYWFMKIITSLTCTLNVQVFFVVFYRIEQFLPFSSAI